MPLHRIVSRPEFWMAVAACVLAAIVTISRMRQGTIAGGLRAGSRVLLVGATLTVLSITLGGSTSPTGTVNVVPGSSIAELGREDNRNAIENVVGNIALFVPLGFLSIIAWRRSILIVTAAALVMSILIETAQFVLGERWVDIDDVILNTTGGFLGALAAVLSAVVVRRLQARQPTQSGSKRPG